MPAKSGNVGRVGKSGTHTAAPAAPMGRRALEREIDAALARLEVGIAEQRKAMDLLLEQLVRPAAR